MYKHFLYLGFCLDFVGFDFWSTMIISKIYYSLKYLRWGIGNGIPRVYVYIRISIYQCAERTGTDIKEERKEEKEKKMDMGSEILDSTPPGGALAWKGEERNCK